MGSAVNPVKSIIANVIKLFRQTRHTITTPPFAAVPWETVSVSLWVPTAALFSFLSALERCIQSMAFQQRKQGNENIYTLRSRAGVADS